MGLSLKYKLLALLVILPSITLGLYLLLAVSLFRSDKEAYVFDSSVSVSRTLSAQVGALLLAETSVMRTILEARGPDSKFTSVALSRLSAEPEIEYLSLLTPDASGTLYSNFSELRALQIQDGVVEEIRKSTSEDALVAKDHDLKLRVINKESDLILLTLRFGKREDPNAIIARIYFHAPTLFTAFKQPHLYATYLIGSQGQVILGSDTDNVEPITDISQWKFFTDFSSKRSPEGTASIKSSVNEDLLASYVRLGTYDLFVISLVPKNVIYRATHIMLIKSILFFIALILACLIVSILASSKLTASLKQLYLATKDIGKGKFDVVVPVKSNDEIGSLANGFNVMASEVSRLMQENIEKGRMEKELETARVVQETLFPEKNSILGSIKISGYYEPASECGGDWWYYFKKENKTFVCIGDATGHGLSAALITSAARSAVSLIELNSDVTPRIFLELLNRAIYEASKGQIQMTFFVACIDTDKNQLVYANASHDPPLLIRKSSNPIKKKDLLPLLLDNEYLRLGQKLSSEYGETAIDFNPGDRVFFYTDGLVDIQDPSGEIWEDRGLIKSLTGAASQFQDVTELMESIANETRLFRINMPLKDDVTFFTCQYLDSLMKI